MNAVTSISLGAASFLLGIGAVLWIEYGSAVFAAMLESGYLLLCH